MNRFQALPKSIRAVQFTGFDGGKPRLEPVPGDPAPECGGEWVDMAQKMDLIRIHPMFPGTRLQVVTGMSARIADIDDIIIHADEDELNASSLNVLSPEAFEKAYEPAAS